MTSSSRSAGPSSVSHHLKVLSEKPVSSWATSGADDSLPDGIQRLARLRAALA